MSWLNRIKDVVGTGKGGVPSSEVSAEPELTVAADEGTNEVEIGVRIESPSPEAVTCPVRFDRAVSPGGTSLFETPDEARAWPAVHALLGVRGVHSIIGKGDALVIARHGSAEWPEILDAIEPALQAALADVGTVRVQRPADLPAPSARETSGSPSEKTSELSESENALRSRVAQVIEEKINPAVASHGGHIDLLDVQGSRVFIHMGGGCQGCAMSSATLKHGVETTLRTEIPEITEILDTTDHASGANPFFSA
ncbi:MAG: NifU family protein [Myxococcota bacterium]|jgi:NFU1 iron-sulfur cluster scaffold homolog, mitochondrial|nr:NifU family protein [Myxococcota bacterium]